MNQGFTVLELVIVIGIMAVVSVVILFDNKNLNSSVLLSNTAYEIQLMVREVQTYGIGVRGVGDTASDFGYSQGIHFSMSDPSKIILFADMVDDLVFGAGEELQQYTINTQRAGSILGICIPNGTTCTAVSQADIFFKRPNPEAIFGSIDPNSAAVAILLGFPSGPCRSIIVHRAGSVELGTRYCPTS